MNTLLFITVFAALATTIYSAAIIETNDKASDEENGEALAVEKRMLGFMPFPGFMPQNEGKRQYSAPPTTCPAVNPFDNSQTCRRSPFKAGENKCDTTECLFTPTIGYIYPPSYLDRYNLGEHFKLRYSKRISVFRPGFGQYGAYGQPMAPYGSQPFNPFQSQASQLSQYGPQAGASFGQPQPNPFPHMAQMEQSKQQGPGQYNGFPQMGIPRMMAQMQQMPSTGYQPQRPQFGQYHQSPPQFNPFQQSLPQFNPFQQSPPQFNPFQQSPPQYSPYQQSSPFNPYSQQQQQFGHHQQMPHMSQYGPQKEYNPYAQGPQGPSVQYVDAAYDPSSERSKEPSTRMGGYYGSEYYGMQRPYANPFPSQMGGPSGSGQQVAILCKHPKKACQCKTTEDCACKSRRPRVCTQKYEETRGIFWVYELVQSPPPSHQYQNPLLKSADSAEDEEHVHEEYTNAQYQQPQYQAPTYKYVPMALYYKKPSGCQCMFLNGQGAPAPKKKSPPKNKAGKN